MHNFLYGLRHADYTGDKKDIPLMEINSYTCLVLRIVKSRIEWTYNHVEIDVEEGNEVY